MVSGNEAVIATLKLEIEKLKRELYGSRSERKARLLAQMELQLEDLEATATEDELAAEPAAGHHDGQGLRAPPSRRASRSRRTCRASGW
jgi:transposase